MTRSQRGVGQALLAICMAMPFRAAPAAEAPPADPCEAPRALLDLGAALPATRQRLLANEALRILAIGSSSTQGHGASRAEFAYPPVLTGLLRARHPGASIEVINAGIGGQTALHVRARLEAEVLRTRPHLVLWQAGANDGMNGVDLQQFSDALVSGAAMLQRAGIELVLVPPQYAPAFNRAKTKDRYLDAMQDVATRYGIPLFRRYDLMRYAAARADPPKLLTADGLHLNDLGYRCLALQIADALEGDGPARDTAAAGATASRPER